LEQLTLVNVSRGGQGTIPIELASLVRYRMQYGHPIRSTLFDSNCQDTYQDYKPADLVGISAVTQDTKHAIPFAEFVKLPKNVPVILGGVE